MATHGINGGVYVELTTGVTTTTTRIVETTNWTIDGNRDITEVVRHHDKWAGQLLGVRRWSGSFDAALNLAGNQTLIEQRFSASVNSKPTMQFWIGAASIPRIEGRVCIEGYSPNGPANNMNAVTFRFRGDGTMTPVGK